MKEKTVKIFYDNISKGYLKTHGYSVGDIILERIIVRNLPDKNSLKILDAGGGCGRFSAPLLKLGHNVVLSDISKNMLEEARMTINGCKNLEFCQESITDMHLQKNNNYDVVLMINAILDYCEDHNKAMREAFRVLKEGGVFMGSVNNRLVYCSMHELKDEKYTLFEKNMETGDRYIVWAGQKEGHYTHEFTLEELKESLLNNGFKIVKILGPFNLMDKDKMELLKNKEGFIPLQIKYAEKKEYINNSSDFFFVAEKSK